MLLNHFFLWILEATQNLSNKIFWPHGIGSIVFNTKITFLPQIFLNLVFTREKKNPVHNNLRVSSDMTLGEKQIVVRKLYSVTQNDSFYFLNVIWGKSFYFYIQSDFLYSKCQLFFLRVMWVEKHSALVCTEVLSHGFKFYTFWWLLLSNIWCRI